MGECNPKLNAHPRDLRRDIFEVYQNLKCRRVKMSRAFFLKKERKKKKAAGGVHFHPFGYKFTFGSVQESTCLGATHEGEESR